MTFDQIRPVTWVIGAGGLLGRSLVSDLRSRDDQEVVTMPIPWSDPDAAASALQAGTDQLFSLCAGRPWRVAWCAGAGVTGTPAVVFEQETATFAGYLDQLQVAADGNGQGSVFLASSAGGVYAGSGQAPFSENDVAGAISPYGAAKLACEQLVVSFAANTGVPVLIGRIANLYGPGQNLSKPQGLISHICRSHITGQPISVYVSLDTVRDYLYVGDCASMIGDGLARLSRQPRSNVTLKIFASGQGVTIGALLGECRHIFKRTPRVVLGTSPNAKFQVRDLRLRSRVWPDLDRRTLTPLSVGIAATVADMRRAMQERGPDWSARSS